MRPKEVVEKAALLGRNKRISLLDLWMKRNIKGEATRRNKGYFYGLKIREKT